MNIQELSTDALEYELARRKEAPFMEYNGLDWTPTLLCDGAKKNQKDWEVYMEGTPLRLPTVNE